MRISTASQKADSQRTQIKTWLQAHGHDQEGVQWFSDTETGEKISRQGIEALNAAIFAGSVKTVVVWKLDRIARNMKDGINILSQWCESGVRVVSVTQQIDLSGTVGQLVASVLFAVAEMELQHIRERQAAGIAAAKVKGVYTGRKKGATKAQPQRARELKQQGLKVREIANALNIAPRTVYSYLKG